MKLDRITTIYAELDKYSIQLHPDPRSLGPLYLTDLIAKTRNYLNAVSRIQLEVHQEKQTLSRDLRAHEVAYQVSADELLANDERVRRLPSIEDRKATVAMFLREERQLIDHLRSEIQDLEFVEKAVRHRHKELTSTMSEIKLQRSLIRDEIDTGAMYGDERKFSHERTQRAINPALGTDDISVEELEQLLAGETLPETPPALPLETPSPKATEVEVVPSENAVRAFLDGEVGQTTTDPDDEFEELLRTI